MQKRNSEIPASARARRLAGHCARLPAPWRSTGDAAIATIQIPGQGEFTLQVKVAVASGTVRRFVVGNPEHQLIDVAAGDTLLRMAEAEKLAAKGQVVVDERTVQILGENQFVDHWLETTSGRFALIQSLEQNASLTPWPPLATGALSEEQLRPWLLQQCTNDCARDWANF